jgi:hypothetical protein
MATHELQGDGVSAEVKASHSLLINTVSCSFFSHLRAPGMMNGGGLAAELNTPFHMAPEERRR